MKKNIYLILFFISCSIYSQSKKFEFALISDTHIGSGTSIEDLTNCVNEINNNSNLKFVIVSGDITESGRTNDWIESKKILNRLNIPFYIIPGNHDTKWSETAGTGFKKVFGYDKFNFEFAGIRFIGLSQGPILRMGDGHFSNEDLNWLKEQLELSKGKPIVLVSHYPINNQIDNCFEYLDIVKKYDIKFILVGHGHSNHFENYEGIKGIMGRSSLKGNKPFGGYNIIKIKDDSVIISEKIIRKEERTWCSFSTNDKIEKKEIDRPNFLINDTYKNIEQRWLFDSKFTITASPFVYKNRVFIGSSEGSLYCLSLVDGKILWKFRTAGEIFATASGENDKIVFGSCDSNIYCLNYYSGELLWRVKTNNVILAVPLIKNGFVYFGSSDSSFRAIDMENGRIKWTYKGIGNFIESKPTISEGKVIFGAWDTYLYALNIETGNIEWKWNNGSNSILYSPAACNPVVSKGKVFICAPDRFVSAIDINSGKTVWRSNIAKSRETIGFNDDSTLVITRSMNDSVFGFSAFPDSAEKKWVINCNYGYDIDPSQPIVKYNQLFFGTKNGFIYSLKVNYNKIDWKYRVSKSLVNNVYPLDDKTIVYSTMDGKIGLLQERTNNDFIKISDNMNFPEGPAWDGKDGLFVSSCYGGFIRKINQNGSRELIRFNFDTNQYKQTNGLTFSKDGSIVACEYGRGKIISIEKNGKISIISDGYNGKRFNRPNDLCFDSLGNLFFTDPKSYSKSILDGRIFKIDKEKNTSLVEDSLAFPNGIAFSNDMKFLFLCESAKKRILKYKYEDGKLMDKSVFVEFTDGDPDGIAFDSSGNLWICIFGSGYIYIADQDGNIIRKIKAPGKKPSNIDFGGGDYRTLFLTEDETNGVYKLEVVIPGSRLFYSPK